MAQLLKVIQDPSIVQNVPTTSLEQLQLATEAKAEQMAKARAAAVASALVATSPYDVQNDPKYPVSAGFREGTWADGQPTAAQRNVNDVVIDRPVRSASSTVDAANPLDAYRLGLTTTRSAPPPVAAIEAATAPAIKLPPRPTADPFAGAIASLFARDRYLTGNPGQTDWSVANQGMGGLGGLVSQSTLAPAAAPAPNAGFNLLSLFGGGGVPAFMASSAAAGSPIDLASSGGGGLAGGSLFDKNAQLPEALNNRRWAGDGY